MYGTAEQRGQLTLPPPSLPPPGALPPPGWYPDPWQMAASRWWDGRQWSWQIWNPSPRAPVMPLEAGLRGLLVLVGSIVGAYLLALAARSTLPILPAIVLLTLCLYGPMAAYCIHAGRRWGTGALRTDYGASIRPIDAAVGLVVLIAAGQAERLAAAAVDVLHLPFVSNTDDLPSSHGDRGLYLTLAAIAIVAAPVVEELFFRGLILSSLRSRFHPVAAVAIQAVIFGMAHVAPVYGWGNIGLVVVLSAVGVVLGIAAQLSKRLGPGMVGHALLNAAVFAVLLTR